MKQLRKCLALTVMIFSLMITSTVIAADDYYVTDETVQDKGNVTYAYGVTPEMTKTSYWAERAYTDPNKVMLSADEIDAITDLGYNTKATNMVNLENIDGEYDADSLSASLANEGIPSDPLYVKGELIDKPAYFNILKTAITTTGFTGARDVDYAICVKGTAIKSWPSNDIIGYSADDTDDEIELSSLMVNEPFVVKQKAVVDGHTFYWGYSTMVTGWVDGDNIALCEDKTEWTDCWKVKTDAKNFVVVVQDKIVLEPNMFDPSISEVKLKFGTILKLVDKEDLPKNIVERGTWNNYVVYLPTRGEEGQLVKKMALISEHCNVHVGFLPLTQSNLIDVSLQCLGNRYGWGGMLDSMDCSLFTRNVYRCFGFELPRNTNWQRNIPSTAIDLKGKTDEEKQSFIEKLPAGALLYFSGHTMVYLGTENHVGYVISALGNVVDSVGPVVGLSQQTVTITPLTVRRGLGTTWLSNLETAVVFAMPEPEETTTEETTAQETTAAQTTSQEIVSTQPTTAPKDVILPKVNIKKVVAKKKSLKLSWKKVKGIKGYKIQYATNKKFKKAKTVTASASKASKTIKGLKSKKLYYVRLRTYRIEKSKNKTITYYSDWSVIKKKKTK